MGCAAKPEPRNSASTGRRMLWEQEELAKEKRGEWEGGGIKHLPPTLEPLQRLKQVKSSSFNGNTSEITSCKPCVPVTAPSPHCPFVPATSLSAGRGANVRLRHRHQLPSIPKCLERAAEPAMPSTLWSGRGQGVPCSTQLGAANLPLSTKGPAVWLTHLPQFPLTAG